MRSSCLCLGFLFTNCLLLIQVHNGWSKGASLMVGANTVFPIFDRNEPTLGVDYYPEQWDANDMIKDMISIRDELGANTIRVGEFMWQMMEPSDGNFNFTFLDTVINNAEQVGLYVMLGTPTATMPAWILEKAVLTGDDDTAIDEIVLKGPDSPDGYEGVYAGFGGRRQYSFNSNIYLQYAQRITAQVAERYGNRDVVKFWQVDNEIGHENSDLDFSENSLNAWRAWLSKKYSNKISELNDDWGTVFWGTSYSSFDQVPLPKWTVPGSSPRPNEVWRSNSNPGMLLDFRRFRRDSITTFTDNMISQLNSALNGGGVKGEITTNAPGGFWDKALDHNDIFNKMDFAGYDNYPVWGGSTSAPLPSTVAIALDTVRGWKCKSLFLNQQINGNARLDTNASDMTKQCSWMVIEQLIGAQGHDIIGYTPRRGQAAAWSSAALLAHGADGLLFFRYRPALFGQEEFCYGVLDHSGDKGNKWYEAKSLFNHAKLHKEVIKSNMKSRIALLYDVENAFTWAAQPQSILFDFSTENHRLYYPFWRNGASIDVLSLPHLLQDLKDQPIPALAAARLFQTYKVLLLPVAAMIGGGDGGEIAIEILRAFVELGGSVWCSFRSDLKDQRSQIRPHVSRLAHLAGVKVSEIESLNDADSPATLLKNDGVTTATASVFREGLNYLATADVEVLFSYTDNFFGNEGYAAVTRRLFHPRESKLNGEVVYIGCGIDPEALVDFATQTISKHNRVADDDDDDDDDTSATPVVLDKGRFMVIPNTGVADSEWLEQVIREDRSGNLWRVAINHDESPHTASDGTLLQPYEVDVARYRLP